MELASPAPPFASIADHIVRTPDICGGKPRIAGHRITVQHVVQWHERGGMTPDEIVARYPGITLADVHAALAYYWDHREEIDGQIAEDERFADELRRSQPSLVKQRLGQSHAGEDPLPSG